MSAERGAPLRLLCQPRLKGAITQERWDRRRICSQERNRLPPLMSPPYVTSAEKKKSQTGSDFFIFMKPTIRKGRMNNVWFDRWCWSKPMKEGTDDKSDVTVRHSQPWLRLTINTVYRRSSKTVERTAVLCCRSCPFHRICKYLLQPRRYFLFSFFLVICGGELHVYPTLENAPTATHLLTFIARNNSSIFFPPL